MRQQLLRPFILMPVASLALTAALIAGPLSPPAGMIAPTPGPEPRIALNSTNTPGDANSIFKITQPGSYYLTGNITGVVARNGIAIGASGVTIDLNGFDLRGVPGSLDGITTTIVSLTDIAVMNGSVRNWGSEGVDLMSTGPLSCRVVDVRVSGNAGVGISALFNTVISNCSAYNNTGGGINANVGCIVTHCSASNNGSSGITIGSGSLVSHCRVSSSGTTGITAGVGSSVLECTAHGNTLDGINCGSGSVIRGNTCHNNGSAGSGAGIRVTGTANRVELNNCTGADFGVVVELAGNFITGNTCSGNTTNWNIVASNKCLVINGASGAAINGNSGGVSPGSTDPNANFTY